MCGRYSITTAPEAMRRLFGFVNPVPDLPPRYNAAPTDKLPVVRLDREGNREPAVLRWGLIPFWAKDEKVGFKSINARAETVTTAPAFREAFPRRRCLVPATRMRSCNSAASEFGGPVMMVKLSIGSALFFQRSQRT